MKNSFKSVFFFLLTTFIILIFTFTIGEIFLRIFSIPGVGLEVNIYNEQLGLIHAKPNSTFIRTNIRGEKIKRKANNFGFYDKQVKPSNTKGIFKIGFFGDSFTESIQVPLEKTFFRIIEDSLNIQNIKTLAFGKSGHGTFHAYLKYKYFSSILKIDKVVYVFFRNDVYDQYYPIKKTNQLPYPEIQNGDIISNDKLLKQYIATENNKFIKKIFKNSYLYQNSILLQTLNKRLYFLRNYGISLANKKDEINNNEFKSTEFRETAKRLFEAVILNWKYECYKNKQEFSIFYVPDKGKYIEKDLDEFSFKPWLKSFCNDYDIDFIDPSNSFLKLEKKGGVIYDDHFSELGHLAFASTFVKKFREERNE